MLVFLIFLSRVASDIPLLNSMLWCPGNSEWGVDSCAGSLVPIARCWLSEALGLFLAEARKIVLWEAPESCIPLSLCSDEWVDHLFEGGVRWFAVWGQVLMSLPLSFSERVHSD